jgi:hypothetical protein
MHVWYYILMTEKEFRNVHSARAYLKVYVDSGRNLEVIREIPLNEIERFDVWQCIFDSEPEAYKELCIKQWYDTYIDTSENDSQKEFNLERIARRIVQIEEWNTAFTMQDAINIVLDCYGMECLPCLIDKTQKVVDIRKDIVKPYAKPDHEWVGIAERVLEKLKQYERHKQIHSTETDH